MKFLKNSSVKAIVVLLCIALISGGLLSILNDVLYVSDEEKQSRALSKIYTKSEVNGQSEALNSQYKTNANFGSVLAAHKAKDGTYVLHTQGIGGYSGGNVNLWLALRTDGQFDNIIIGSSEKQSYIGKFTQKYLTDTYTNKPVKGVFTFSAGGADDLKVNPVSTATGSSTAILNAVNMALYYGRNALKIGENPEAEALQGLKALNSAYANYNFVATARYQSVAQAETIDGLSVVMNYIFTSSTAAEKDNVGFVFTVGSVKIAAVANIASKTLVHVGVVGGSNITSLEGKTLAELKAISGLSGDEAAARAAGIRAVDYVSNSFKAYVSSFSVSISGARATYEVRGVGYENSSPYTLTVIIENNAIVSVTIKQSGWTWDGHTDNFAANIATLNGKTLANIDGVIFSGSSESRMQVIRILKCCLTDYQNQFNS